jgi:hypothetical protein
LFHDPSLATRRIVLTAVDRLFAAANFAFTLGNLEFAVEDILGSGTGVVHPAGDSEVSLLHNLLDDGGGGGELGDGTGVAGRARRGLYDTARSTDEDLSLTASHLIFALSNVTLALSEGLGSLGSDVSPNAFVDSRLRVGNDVSRWRGGSRSVLGRQREHHSKDGKDQREDKEESRR